MPAIFSQRQIKACGLFRAGRERDLLGLLGRFQTIVADGTQLQIQRPLLLGSVAQIDLIGGVMVRHPNVAKGLGLEVDFDRYQAKGHGIDLDARRKTATVHAVVEWIG